VLAKGDIMHCAGGTLGAGLSESFVSYSDFLQIGFMIDEPLFQPYLGTRLGDEDSVIGMPLKLTLRLLAQAGYPLP
jgi:septum formation protein